MICISCAGTGRVAGPEKKMTSANYYSHVEVRCPACSGTGQRASPKMSGGGGCLLVLVSFALVIAVLLF